MSAKCILEKYTAERNTLPAVIGAAFQSVISIKHTAPLEKVTVWQDEEFPFTMMRFEEE